MINSGFFGCFLWFKIGCSFFCDEDIKSDKVIVLPMRPDNERMQSSARFALACMNHHMVGRYIAVFVP